MLSSLHFCYLIQWKPVITQSSGSIDQTGDKILDMTKLKAFADNIINVAQMMISDSDRVENTVGEKENAGYQHFLLLPQCF